MENKKTVDEWNLNPLFSNIFDDITIFDSILNGESLHSMFVDLYGFRYIYISYEGDVSCIRLRQIIKRIGIRFNYKYSKLLNTINIDYDPISNYDMTETGTDIDTPDITIVNNGNDKNTHTANNIDNTEISDDTSVHDSVDNNTSTINLVTTYDDSDYRNNNKQTVDTTNIQTTTTNVVSNQKGNHTISENISSTNDSTSKTTGTTTTTHNLTRKGNIGVTTTQHMLEQERQIANYNIIDSFLKDVSIIICMDSI